MRFKRTHLGTAANGHLVLVVRRAGLFDWIRLHVLLRLRYGFCSEGRWILGAGEALLPDFVRGELKLLVSHESRIGLSLLSESDEGDAFLRTFATRHAGVATVHGAERPGG